VSVRKHRRRKGEPKKWVVQFVCRGRQVRRVSPVQSRRGAEAFERELLAQLALSGSTPGESPRVKLADFVPQWFHDYVEVNNKFSTCQEKRGMLTHHIVPWFGEKYLDEIGIKDIEEFKAFKLREKRYGTKRDGSRGKEMPPISKKRLNNILACLRRLLNTAHEWGLIDTVPKVKAFKVPKPEVAHLEPDEQARLLEASEEEPEWHNCIVVALYAGLRIGELMSLRWTDVDLERGEITVRRAVWQGHEDVPKGGTVERVPVSDSVVEALLDQKRRSALRGELVFSRPDGSMWSTDPMYSSLWRQCRRAGIRKIAWHALRHSGASNLARAGRSLLEIQLWLRDKSYAMASRYVHLSPSDLRNAVQDVELGSDFGQTGDHPGTSAGVHQVSYRYQEEKMATPTGFEPVPPA